MPAHEPVLALSVWPSSAVPEIVGSAVLTGGPVVIVAVASLVALLRCPAALSAVTTARSVSPICELSTR